MKRLVTLVLLLVSAVLAAAVWMLVRDEPIERVAGSRVRDRFALAGLSGAHRDTPEGVRASEVSSAETLVSGQVVDLDGVPLDEGTLMLSCIDADGEVVAIREGVARITETGAFRGPGCPHIVCADLQHHSMIRADAWLLRSGVPARLGARPRARLEGMVVDSGGNPVSGATVGTLIPQDEDALTNVPFLARTVTSDEDGRFAFVLIEMPPCDPCAEALGTCSNEHERQLPVADRVVLIASANGHRAGELAIDVAAGGPVRLVLGEPAAAITGTLTDETGAPYARASIIARSLERRYEQHRVMVDRGTFSIDDLGEGPHELRAIQDGTELARAHDILPGAHVQLHGRWSAHGIVVTLKILREATGGAVSGVEIDGGPFNAVRTDLDGRVVAHGVMPGEYGVMVRGSAGEPTRHVVHIPEQALRDQQWLVSVAIGASR